MGAKVFIPKRAFILAAGMGTRMRPMTDETPKPMLEIAERSLIYHILDKLALAGVNEVMVNAHYQADKLRTHLKAYPQQKLKISVSYEPEILDTGGGVANVLPFFKDEPFYVIAGDAFWTEGKIPALMQLAQHWDEARMDILTLLEPVARMSLTQGAGDYDLLSSGKVRRSGAKKGRYMWTNIRLNHPRLYQGAPKGPFSFLRLMDACEAGGRFYALEHGGLWHHISTPRDLEAVNRAIAEGAARERTGERL